MRTRNTVIFATALSLSSFVVMVSGPFALAEDEKLSASNLVTQKTFQTDAKNPAVTVVVRKNTESIGQNFLVEMRPHCGGTKSKHPPVTDVTPACDVDQKFVKLDKASQQIVVRIRQPNSDLHNFNSVNDKATAPVQCNQRWTLVTFDPKTACSE